MLSEREALRFGRNVLLPEIGVSGQERLRAGGVRIEGLGAVGSAAAIYLCAAGVGRLELRDDSPVAPSDLAGTLFSAADLGEPRAAAAVRALARIDPDLRFGDGDSIAVAAADLEPGASPGVRWAQGRIEAHAGPGPDALLAGALAAAEAVKALLDVGERMDREGVP